MGLNVQWVIRRLRAMSGREVGYRVQQRVRATFEQVGLLTPPPPAPIEERRRSGWAPSFDDEFDPAPYRRAADEVLAGRFNVFAMQPADLGFPPEWNRDPKTGVRAPLTFGKSLDYRNASLVGDIKYLWEPSRHAELVTLAQAWRLTGDERYAHGGRILLESWFDQCPYPLGAHWTSSLEHAVRLIHWSFAWRLLGGHGADAFQDVQGRRFRERWLAAIHLHCRFIAHHFSRFSSANNHLIGELTGLLVAAITWPYWRESDQWRSRAQHELEREALLQNGADGVNREQASWYHHEVADMLLLAGLAVRATGDDFSSSYWTRWRAMIEYLASIMDVSGRTPSFGDSDDAVIARLDPKPDSDPYKALLAAGAVLFGDPRLKYKAGALDDKTRWLLGREARARFDALRATREDLPVRRVFREGGYYILGSGFETPDEIRVIVDAGPLGYLSIAAHGHADALSFTLSAAGRELLIDPGTFAYHTQREWRDYFRGTAAHNTVRIDGQDQSVSGGAFLWNRHARVRVIDCDLGVQAQRLVAEHDGYLRLSDPVLHRRELRFDARRAELTVIDEISCAGEHRLEQLWHFPETCVVEHERCAIVARNVDVRLTMTLAPELHVELHRGRETPPLGWISRALDVRTPSPTVSASLTIRGSVRLVARLAIHTPSRDERTSARSADRVRQLTVDS